MGVQRVFRKLRHPYFPAKVEPQAGTGSTDQDLWIN
jgi:hypothetical protein